MSADKTNGPDSVIQAVSEFGVVATAKCATFLQPAQNGCSSTSYPSCLELDDALASRVAGFETALVRFAAPISLQVPDTRLQADLAVLDSALVDAVAMVAPPDPYGLASLAPDLEAALALVDQDANKILERKT